jgi:PadR family transcriptional regulator, regulatory protein AphA
MAAPGAEASATTSSYVLLGLLSVRSWTGYELTQQVRHSLAHVWPASEANLYREQRRLVRLGWASVEAEPAGPERIRNRYTITDSGRAELSGWQARPPAPAALEVEAMLRVWFADAGTPADLTTALRRAADDARSSLDRVVAVFTRYLAGAGAFPERAHLNAIVGEMVADLFGLIEFRCRGLAEEVAQWPTTVDRGLDPMARARMQRVVTTYGPPAPTRPDEAPPA